MKNWNFTKKYTDHKIINSNSYVKFEVNWQRGSQFTAALGAAVYFILAEFMILYYKDSLGCIEYFFSKEK
jgi:coproporphyrinogen III oxidase